MPPGFTRTSGYPPTPRVTIPEIPTSFIYPTEAGSPTALKSLPFPVVQQFEETSYSLKDVDFISANIGWAVGDPHWDQTLREYTGTVIKTIDGGLTWKPQKTDIVETLRNVDFVDETNGWAVGTNGTIIHTTDGGEHWIRQAVDSQDEFRGVSFISATEGWATSFHSTQYDPTFGTAVNWKGSVWHTEDGGESWQQQGLPENASLMNRIKFLDAQEGWAVGQKYMGEDEHQEIIQAGVVYHTADGGKTWEELYSPELNIIFTAVEWTDKSNGWVAGFPGNSGIEGGCVFHTRDGGKTWERQSPPCDVFAPLWDMQFADANRGYVVGFDYASPNQPIYRTMDGGETWEEVLMDQREIFNSPGIYSLSIVDDQVILVGDNDYLARSDRPWEKTDCADNTCLFTPTYLNPHFIFHDVFFPDDKNGWAVGSKNYSPGMWGQVILHTADGGGTWSEQYEMPPLPSSSSNDRLESVAFVDPLNGWAVGTYNYQMTSPKNFILHTADGGKTWESQGMELNPTYFPEFSSVRFLDRQNGWALASENFYTGSGIDNLGLAHTVDGGQHWTWVDTGLRGRTADCRLGLGASKACSPSPMRSMGGPQAEITNSLPPPTAARIGCGRIFPAILPILASAIQGSIPYFFSTTRTAGLWVRYCSIRPTAARHGPNPNCGRPEHSAGIRRGTAKFKTFNSSLPRSACWPPIQD